MRILFSTWGSKGDLHPFLSWGRVLRQRGHEVTLAGNPFWEEEVVRAGLKFLAAGPAQEPERLFDHPELIGNRQLGLPSLKALITECAGPTFEPAFQALSQAAPEHDCLVAHHFVLSAGMVAERTGIPWASVTLAPGVIPSRYGLPGPVAWPIRTGPVARACYGAFWGLGKYLARPVVDPVINELRKRHGLSPIRDAIFHAASPQLNIQLYSPWFASRAPDWSAEKKMAGFCFWDPVEDYQPPVELSQFLENGEKPWLFTLGTSVVSNPRDFYQAACDAVAGTEHRAILLIGHDRNAPERVPDNVLILKYAPYGWLMPRCSVVAHQCGVGTLAQVLRAGLPSVCCPFAFDQPNNAMRLVQNGLGIYVPPKQRTGSGLQSAFEELLSGGIPHQARKISDELKKENGAELASRILEQFVEDS